jgi:lysozyme family protein
MHDLDEALEYLLAEEGGWSNHPADRGGKPRCTASLKALTTTSEKE